MHRLLGVFIVVALVAGAFFLTPGSSEANMTPEHAGGEYVRTPDAARHDAACATQSGSGHTCVEWCDRYQGGLLVPSGRFCCVVSNGVCVEQPG